MPNLSKKWLVCLVSVYITGTNGWNATKVTLGKDKEFIMFDDMHNIFMVTAGHD